MEGERSNDIAGLELETDRSVTGREVRLLRYSQKHDIGG